jgi:hypothetical protein
MEDYSSVLWAVLIGLIAAIPILIGFRAVGRQKCWRCHVWMHRVRRRERIYPLTPIGQCEGCGVWCLALGPRAKKIVPKQATKAKIQTNGH